MPGAYAPKKVGAEHRLRNTCLQCNSGWMSRIESMAKPAMTSLMFGEPILLDRVQQMLVASLLCLIAVRNEFSALAARGVSDGERKWLRTTLTPPWNWQIWIARYRGVRPNEHWCLHLPCHIASTPSTETGPDKCNTQTTTLAVGRLSAHLFSSTEILDFPGYSGINLCKIWPPRDWLIDWRVVQAYNEAVLRDLAESFSRETMGGEPF